MARRRHPYLTPLDLHDTYPEADLLGLDYEPTPLTTWAEFRNEFGVQSCGDTLFIFICNECGEDWEELRVQQRRMDTAIRDLMAVRLRCDALLDGEIH